MEGRTESLVDRMRRNIFSKILEFPKDGGDGVAWKPSPSSLTLWAASLGTSNGVRMRVGADSPEGHGRHQTTTRLSPTTRLCPQRQQGCPGPGEEIWAAGKNCWRETIPAFTQHPVLSSAAGGQDGVAWVLRWQHHTGHPEN